MNPDDGNIYTPEQAKKLGLPFDDLIPLGDLEAKRLIVQRRDKAQKIARKKKLKAQRAARKRNR